MANSFGWLQKQRLQAHSGCSGLKNIAPFMKLFSCDSCGAVCASGETLRVAVDQTRQKITNVACFDCAAAYRAMFVVARHAVIDKNESS
jgi:RNase P subunit RPR2